MMTGTLARYFGMRFLGAVIAIFIGLLLLVAMVDFIEMMRRTSEMKDVSAILIAKISLYRVPHLTPMGQPHVIGGAWTAVFRLQDGRWVIVQEHLSDSPTP